MRIGFDVDGILAGFHLAYQPLVVKCANGVDLFKPGDLENPPCWNWPEYRGYTAENGYPGAVKSAWAEIKASSIFWMQLVPLPDTLVLRQFIADFERHHEVYYVTSRPGRDVKRQSEIWLSDYLNYARHPLQQRNPTVLITGHGVKGDVAKALNLDVYVDDNFDNVMDVAAKSPSTRTYLRNMRYNADDSPGVVGPLSPLVTRVENLLEMFDIEASNLYPDASYANR